MSSSTWGIGFAAWVLGLTACGAGATATSRLPSVAAAPAPLLPVPQRDAALPSLDAVTVLSARRVPAGFEPDARLDEWQALAPGAPSATTPSFAIVAANANGVVLAGRVRNVTASGLWIRLATEPPPLPPIGSFQRGGGIVELSCDSDREDPSPMPFDVETCRALLASYGDLGRHFAEMFVRLFHVTPHSVSLLQSGQETPVAGAAYAWQANEDAVTFELAIPLTALPRTAESELASLQTHFVRANAVLPDFTDQTLSFVPLAEPMSFGIDSGVLTCMNRAGSGFPHEPRFAYQPGAPNRVYRTDYRHGSGFALEVKEVPLSVREAELGSFELRSAYGAVPVLAIFNQGQLVDCRGIGRVLGVISRGRGLHVIAYQEEYAEEVGLTGATFQVLELEEDGTIHDDLLEMPENGFGYLNVGERHAKGLATFSIAGLYPDEGGSREHILSWRYDARSNRYMLSQRPGRFFPNAEN